jgi:hypothetical protein
VIPGCPSPAFIAQPRNYVGDDLADDEVRISNLTASGGTAASSCAGLPAGGFFNANPTITLTIQGFDDDWNWLRIRTNNTCEAALLVRDAAGNWHAGRTNNSDNRVRIAATQGALNGQISIWLGMDASGQCSGAIVRFDIED